MNPGDLVVPCIGGSWVGSQLEKDDYQGVYVTGSTISFSRNETGMVLHTFEGCVKILVPGGIGWILGKYLEVIS